VDLRPGGGVGIDLIEIDRVEAALERRPGLAERIFSQGELEYAERHARPGRHLAARFAAKEAVVKAIGEGGIPLSQVEIHTDGEGVPRVELSGRASASALSRGLEISVSLTHSREMAGAVALARVSSATD
jgi:holo-[acyl-carrier protein] synthase